MDKQNIRSFSLASLAVSVSTAALMGATGVAKAEDPVMCFMGPCTFLAFLHGYEQFPPQTVWATSTCYQDSYYSCACYHPEGWGPWNLPYEVIFENPYQCYD